MVLVVGALWLVLGTSYCILAQLFHRPPSIVLINNSGAALTFAAPGTRVEIPATGSTEFNYPAQAQVFDIRTLDKTVWRYRWVPYQDLKFQKDGHVYMQIEEDRRIFLLTAKGDGPAKAFPSQPPGYPLRPEKIN
jgi:hypothetical protein